MDIRQLTHRTIRLTGAALLGAALLVALGCRRAEPASQSRYTEAAYAITTHAAQEQLADAAATA